MQQAATLLPQSSAHDMPAPQFPEALRAFDLQQQSAIAHGQLWSDQHASVFLELQQSYVLTARGLTLGRKAWGLAVGTGKSQSIVAFMQAQAEQVQRGKAAPSLLVCVERVAQMQELYDAAIQAGVPCDVVGMYHTKNKTQCLAEGIAAGFPRGFTESVTEPSAYRFLISTHARMLKGEQSITSINTYGNGERSLIVWDESLIHSRPVTLPLLKVDTAAYTLSKLAGGTDARDAAAFVLAHIKRLEDQLNVADEIQQHATLQATLSADDETRFTAAIGDTLRTEQDARDKLLKFIEHAGRPMRAVAYNEAGRRVGLIQYDTLIPNSLERLIVLDASHTVRLLCSEHDSTVTAVRLDTNVKRFDSVAIKQLKQGAGREKLSKELLKGLASPLVQDIVAEIASYPKDEAVLVVNLKQPVRAKRIETTHQLLLKDALKDAGIDPEELLKDGSTRRFEWITWGNHIGVNRFKHCKHVVCVGVLRRSQLDLAASIAAQRQDITSPQASDAEQIRRVELSEMFHSLMQCAGRGSCRETVSGQASPMTLAFACPDEFPSEYWRQAMPGAVISEWVPKFAKRETRQAEAVKAINDALGKLDPHVKYVSAKTLRTLADLGGLPLRTYGLALSLAKRDAQGWAYSTERRGFFRASPFSGIEA